MGFVQLIATCVRCSRPFMCNPHKVPSVRIDGKREPICRACVEFANPIRIEKGLPPIEILPGAYEALPEEEL